MILHCTACSIVRPSMATVVTPGTLILTLTTVASLAAAAGDGLARGWHQGEEEGGSVRQRYEDLCTITIIIITILSLSL